MSRVVLLLSILICMPACVSTLHYPTVGIKAYKVRPTNWRGTPVKRCCLATHTDHGKKIYFCDLRTVKQCDLARTKQL